MAAHGANLAGKHGKREGEGWVQCFVGNPQADSEFMGFNKIRATDTFSCANITNEKFTQSHWLMYLDDASRIVPMFDWFKRKSAANDDLESFTKQLIKPQALAVAVAEVVVNYCKNVQAGRISAPAYKRRDDGVVAIWRDTRFEALALMFAFGKSEPKLLADIRRQPEIFRVLIEEKPHLEFPQPRGETVADTLQGVWQTYVFLDRIGTEVADRETDRYRLKADGKDIFSNLMEFANSSCSEWVRFAAGEIDRQDGLPIIPKTLFEYAYGDITAKTKSIALSAQFGPHYLDGLKTLEKTVKDKGEDTKNIRAMFEQILKLKDPDHFTDWVR